MSEWAANSKFSGPASPQVIVMHMYFSQLLPVPPPWTLQARTHVDNEEYNSFWIWHVLHKNYSACRVHVSYGDLNAFSCRVEKWLFGCADFSNSVAQSGATETVRAHLSLTLDTNAS